MRRDEATQVALDKEMEPVEKLEAAKRAGDVYHLPDYLKRCLGAVLDLGVEHQRNPYCYALACELRRLGYEGERAEKILIDWNENLTKCLPIAEIRSCVKSAYKDSKNYGCNSELLKTYCVGEDICPFYRQLKRTERQRDSVFDYVSLKWIPKLKPTQATILALIIPTIENRRRVYGGAWLIVTFREIRRSTGYSLNTVKSAVEGLYELGLIELKRGVSCKSKEATQIRRVLPIPRPEGPDKCQKWNTQVSKIEHL